MKQTEIPRQTKLCNTDPLTHTIKELQEFCKVHGVTWEDGEMTFKLSAIKNEKEVMSLLRDYQFYVNGHNITCMVECFVDLEVSKYSIKSEFLEFED